MDIEEHQIPIPPTISRDSTRLSEWLSLETIFGGLGSLPG